MRAVSARTLPLLQPVVGHSPSLGGAPLTAPSAHCSLAPRGRWPPPNPRSARRAAPPATALCVNIVSTLNLGQNVALPLSQPPSSFCAPRSAAHFSPPLPLLPLCARAPPSGASRRHCRRAAANRHALPGWAGARAPPVRLQAVSNSRQAGSQAHRNTEFSYAGGGSGTQQGRATAVEVRRCPVGALQAGRGGGGGSLSHVLRCHSTCQHPPCNAQQGSTRAPPPPVTPCESAGCAPPAPPRAGGGGRGGS